MTTQTAEKIYKEVRALKQETRDLRDLVFLVLKDSEGEYRNSFIKRVLKKSHSSHQFTFANKADFLKLIA